MWLVSLRRTHTEGLAGGSCCLSVTTLFSRLELTIILTGLQLPPLFSFNLIVMFRKFTALALIVFLNILATQAVFASHLDSDGDGIYDEDEATYGFDPANPDEDGNSVLDGEDDYDGDGLSTVAELYMYFTNPTSIDTDADGRSDYAEIIVSPLTDPNDSDSDDDGLSDTENALYGTNPNDSDSDNDGTNDGAEVGAGTNPLVDERTFIVEAGPDEGFGFRNTVGFTTRAYILGSGYESVSTGTISWGDGTSDFATLTAGSDRVYIQGSHLYSAPETFTVTVCVVNGEALACDTARISMVGSSSGSQQSTSSTSTSTNTTETEEETVVETTTEEETTEEETTEEETAVEEEQEVVPASEEGEEETQTADDAAVEEDQEVILTEGEEADCSAMAFTDVSDDMAFFDSLCSFWAADVIHGKDSYTFDPEDMIRRDEASKVFTRLFGYVSESYDETPAVEESSFVDVDPETEVLAYYMEVAAEEDLMEIDVDSVKNEEGEIVDAAYFRPHEGMTVGEIVNTLDVITGKDTGATLEEEGYDSEDTMTRGSFVDFLFGLVD